MSTFDMGRGITEILNAPLFDKNILILSWHSNARYLDKRFLSKVIVFLNIGNFIHEAKRHLQSDFLTTVR